MKEEPTKTPWFVSECYGHAIIIDGKDHICSVSSGTKARCDANARMIVTCVNSHYAMIKALENMLDLCESYMRNPLSDDGVKYCNARAMARAALELTKDC